MDPQALDGSVTYAIDDSVPALSLLNALGCERISWFGDLAGGGNVSLTSLLQAAMVVEAGLANNVVVFRAINGRSESRLGGKGRTVQGSGGMQFTAPVGWTTYGQFDAMMARRHMEKYGTTEEHLGSVAISARRWAQTNPSATLREPLTMDQYLNSPFVASPFRVLDFCQESDCAFAFVIGRSGTSAWPSREIEMVSGAHGGGFRPGADNWGHIEWPDHSKTFSHWLRESLFGRIGVQATDIDAFYLYDCFTFTVISQLEGFGLAEPGEGGPLAASGALAPGGILPVNSHGGLLSEGYGHGMNHVYEAMLQLRVEAGARQLPDVNLALVSGGATTTGCAVLLAAP